MSGDWDSQHLSQHGDADLEPNSGEKAGKHGLGEKVGDEAQFEQSRQQQEPSGKQRNRPRQRNISRAGCGRQAGDSSGEDGRGRGVGGNHQVAGGAEGGKCHGGSSNE